MAGVYRGFGDALFSGLKEDNPKEIVFEPPISVVSEIADDSDDRLAQLICDKIIPRLLALHNGLGAGDSAVHPGQAEIAELARLVVGPENSDAMDYILGLRDRGLSLDMLHLELLEPAARYLGELWDEDDLDFLDVAIGVTRLQHLVHMFAGLDEIAPYDDKRRALIVTTPGESHSFGNMMVQKFLRAGGWYVCACPGAEIEQISAIVAQEWIGVIGFSMSADNHIDSLASSVAAARAASMNPNVGVMVGGPAFARNPQLAVEIGADGTAANAPAAVVLAKKLLVRSITPVRTPLATTC
jgi:MerR family transcriptional regulator, light-induced transcriptional regulator